MDVFDNGHNHEGPFDETFLNELNKKIILVSMVSLSILLLLVFSLYLYNRHVLQTRQSRRRANIINRLSLTLFYDHTLPPTIGLDPALVATLPVYIVESKVREAHGGGVMECVVCLSGFEDEEIVKLLPNCEHYFHVQCIDTWLASHSTCPLCRTWVPPRLELHEGSTTMTLDDAPSMVLPMLEPTLEGTSDGGENKIEGSNSPMSSFRNVPSRESSSRRSHLSSHDDVDEDLER